jgi:thiosulfate reductase cytochrome b subunit
MNLLQLTKTCIHILLFIVIILYIITGFGITEYRIIESLTFGFLTKQLSFQVHNSLTIPFILLVTIHIILSLGKKIKKQNKK